MKLFAICVARNAPDMKEAVILSIAYELSSFTFFQKQGAKEMATFFCRTFAKKVVGPSRTTIDHEDYCCHVHARMDELSVLVLTDKEYPQRAAFSLISKVMKDFTDRYANNEWAKAAQDNQYPLPSLDATVKSWQNPADHDILNQLEKEIDVTKQIMHRDIDSALGNNVKLDDLMAQSKDLNRATKVFYKDTKKANKKCCLVM